MLQSYRLSSHLRETGRWPLRGEGEWRVGIRTCRQNPETVSPRPWISRLCPFQIRWATQSPLLCRCPARNLGSAFRKASTSLDHLVGAGEQLRWHSKSEHPRGLMVDDQLQLARLYDRKVRRFGTL